ncbi:MAG: nucleoside triphosphate pyrophosphohydrolase [Oscillospiraceae bacterium]|nr:nucleoside triphosphate pyrophosphohydrolase [Oscillospiraceae bacterium]
MNFRFKEKYNIDDMLEIMKILRSENGCPWDREQDHHSIRKDFIEEVYEVIEAIDTEDTELLKEELGDVLLQVVFHARIEEENGSFDFSDVVNDICQKLVIRHPHVFGDVSVSNTDEVLKNWNNIKQETKGQETYTETLESVCSALPALMRAQKLGQRAKRAGMDFADINSAVEALESEIAELKKAISENSNIKEELGDVLFSAVNVSRMCGIDAEEALSGSSDKFISRFRKTEELVRFDGIDMKSLNIDELDVYWRKAKEIK